MELAYTPLYEEKIAVCSPGEFLGKMNTAILTLFRLHPGFHGLDSGSRRHMRPWVYLSADAKVRRYL